MQFGMLEISYPDGTQDQRIIEEKRLRIGRALDNELVLVDEQVSRHHAGLLGSRHGVEIIDLGSSNGVFVDNKRIDSQKPVLLADGAIIEIGGT